MDRLDLLAVFVAVAGEGSFVAAARRTGRSPAAVTRAVGALESHFGTRLFTRTTRAVALTEAGARHLDSCRRILAEYEGLASAVGADASEPAGLLTLTAPEMFGRLHLLPVAQRFMHDHPAVDIMLLLLNRLVAFVDEGIDLGVRIAELADSSLRAVRVGAVQRVVCASPDYLAQHGTPATPRVLAADQVIVVGDSRPARLHWIFAGSGAGLRVPVAPRLVLTTVQAALDAAVAGGGFVRVLSYQAEALEAAGLLQRVLAGYEPPPIPIHIVHPAGRYVPPKVGRFIDAAVAALRPRFGG